MRYNAISSELFITNRERLSAKLKPSSIALFCSADQLPDNGDQTHPYSENSDFFYHTGIVQEESILLVFPDSPIEQYKEVLFVRETNEHLTIWEGEKYTKEKAQHTSGVNTIKWTSDFDGIFQLLMHHCENVYFNLNENDRSHNSVPYRDLRMVKESQSRFPLHSYQRLGPIQAELRSIKSELEVELIQKACNITGQAFHQVLKSCKPGMKEYEIEAEMTYQFIKRGSSGHAYEPIVAGGANACVLHYTSNDQQLNDGDLMLLDFGARYANYASDMSRTIPVNGKFTERQKAVYNAVLSVFRQSMQLLQPGAYIEQINKDCGQMMEKELVDLGLLKLEDIKQQSESAPLYKQYFMHGLGHFMGLDVHDIGDRYKPLKSGMVMTCEPGIYIREEGIGIRLENDILITDDGPVDLMSHIPIEADEIEEIMQA